MEFYSGSVSSNVSGSVNGTDCFSGSGSSSSGTYCFSGNGSSSGNGIDYFSGSSYRIKTHLAGV